MTALSRLLSSFALYLSVIGLVGMTLIISWQVFARYVLSAPPSWTEQAALFLMLWFILFAAATGVREGFHIRLTIGQAVFSNKAKYLIGISHAIVLIFGAFMFFNGAELILATWSHVIPTIGIPRGLAYVPVACAGGLIVFFSAEHLICQIRGKEVEPLWS